MYRIAVALIALCLVVLPVLSCGTADVFVIDGDTIRLSNGERVRYIGIDAPEKGEPYFEEATRANEQLVQDRSLRLESDVTNEDRYGRLLRYVFAEDILVNAELVRQGLALVYRRGKFPDEKYFDALRQAAEEAAAVGRGIWSLGLDHPKLRNSQEDYFLPCTTTDQLPE